MKKVTAMRIIFVAAIFICSNVFAQVTVNNFREEAAKAAKERAESRRNHATSQVGWLNNVINTVNMNQPAYKDIAAANNKAIEESKYR